MGAPRSPEKPLRPATFFVVRAPLLPHRTLEAWSEGLRLATATDGELEEALAADRATLTERLRAHVADPVFREAVFCASPSLDEGVREWLRDPASPRATNVASILVRYLSRMASRATPFGLFSSCGMSRVGSGPTRIAFAEEAVGRHTRLDMQYLTGLVQELEKRAEVRAALRFRPSSGLHRLGDLVHHAEAEMRGTPKVRSYRLVSFDWSAALELVLARAADGARPGELAAALRQSDPDIDEASARTFVEELIDAQALVSELSLPLTGDEPIHHLVAALRRCEGCAAWADALEEVHGRLAALDRGGVGRDERPYLEIREALEALPAPIDLARLFQVDLVRSARGSTLGDDFLAEVDRGIELLRRIAVPTETSELSAFAAAFKERYEGREVPLCEVLDDETGIGFGSTSSVPTGLLDGLPFPGGGGDARARFGAREAWIARRLIDLERDGAREWVLDEADLKALEAAEPTPLPASLAVATTVAAASPQALAAGEFRYTLALGGGGGDMLGRFCHGDAELREAVVELLRAEEATDPDVIFAEIVHQPEGRVGNILLRPILREWEIPYLARAGVDRDHTIELSDLLVSIGSRGVVRLRSRKLGRWVEPRMSTAHNPRTISLGIYRFLCALRQPRAETHPMWDWGPSGIATHLPRVRHGKLVLAVERWSLDKHHLAPLQKAAGVARHRTLRSLRASLRLPRHVAVADGDHVLRIDLDDVLSCESLFDLVKHRERLVLHEVFPADGQHVVEGPNGFHAAEVLLPRIATSVAPRPAPPTHEPALRRTFSPGSPWLYAKIYSGQATSDAILRDVVTPLVDRVRASGAADRWFFIRYADPLPHLRIRFHGDPGRLLAEVLPALHAGLDPFVVGGRVHRVGIDTYVREIERYGGDSGMEACEALFEADSDLVLRLIAGFDGMTDADVRWRLTLPGMDRLLSDLGLGLPEKLALLRDVRDGFAREHRADVKLEREMGAKFRAHRAEIEALVEGQGPSEPPALTTGLAALDVRSAAAAAPVRTLLDAQRAGRLTTSLLDLASSLLHMHCNRLLAAEHRAQELVLYDFLHRIYESRTARARRARAAANAEGPAT